MGKCKDLTGMRFGRLTVVRRSADRIRKDGKKDVVWHCNCDCGNNCDVYATNLTSKTNPTRSCGCLAIELRKEQNRKENVYDLTSFEYGVGYDSNGKEFYFDKEDFELIKGYCWVVHITKRKRKDGTTREKITVCANGKYHNGKRKAVLLHRLVMGLYDTEFCNNEVDHIDRNPLNNQKSNLRICTNQQNSFNRGIRNNNTTGIIGVRKTYNNKFIATIGYNYKKQYLGTYETLLDAAIAYNEKALELYGEFANLNDLENIKGSYTSNGR